MGTMINGNEISNFYIAGNKINGFAKNGEVVFKLEQGGDITSPVINMLKVQNYYNPFQNENYAKLSDNIVVNIEVSETLASNPILVLGGEEFTMNLINEQYNTYSKYVVLTEDMNLTENEKISVTIKGLVDAAGNEGQEVTSTGDSNYYVIYDSVAPIISGVEDGETYANETLSPTITDTNLQTVTLNGTEFTSGTEISISGTYNLVATDKAGNISDVTFELVDDDTPPIIEILSSSLGSQGYYRLLNLKVTDNVEIETLRINNQIVNKSGAEIEILDGVDFNFTDGSILIEAIDIGGNVSQKTIVVDKTPPVIDLSNIPNTFEIGVDIYTYPEAGIATDNLDTSVNFSNVNIEWFKATEDGGKGEAVANFEWDTTLENREPGDYYIDYHINDKAGNRGEAHRILTLYKTGDITPPVYQTLGIFNTTHFSSGGDIHYATNGNNIRVLIWFKEKLEVEPKLALLTNDGYVDLEGNEAFKYSNDGREDVHYYISNFILKDTMNLPEGEIQIKVYDYADAAGNVGETLTNKDINNASYTHVIYDTVAPTRVYSTVELSNKDAYIGEDNNSYYYVKNGEEFEFAIQFTEELQQPPTVTIGGRNIEMILNATTQYLYEGTFTISENESELLEGNLAIEVLNVKDKAGNIMQDTNQTPTSNGRIVVYDRTPPIFTNIVDGRTYTYAVTPRIQEANLDSAQITRPNGSTENYPINQNGAGQQVGVDGNYIITVTDRAGNSSTVSFTIAK